MRIPAALIAMVIALGPSVASAVLPPRLAMTRVRGDSSSGAEILQQSLKQTLAEGVDLVDPTEFDNALRKTTGGKGQPVRLSNEGFAAAGKEVGADYVLTVAVSRTGYLYTAHAQLVSTASAAVAMDFRAGFYRPTAEAADRARKIAKKTIEKVERLRASKARATATGTKSVAHSDVTPPRVPGPGESGGRDEDIFGEAEIGDVASAAGGHDDEIFGAGLAGPGVEETERRLVDLETKVKGGGRLFLRLNYLIVDQNVGRTSAFTSPNILDLYVDARLNDRVRAYAQARVAHDPTLVEGPSGTFGSTVAKTQFQLDQLWAKFDVFHTVYVTVGRQRIKWGVGRFWNPTDFLNPAPRDPLAVFDQRLGVGLVKLHLPIELLSWNFYAIATFDDTDLLKRIGGAFRAEILIGQAEVTVSVAARNKGPVQLGLDLSAGLAFLELRAEGALVHNTNRPFYTGRFDPENGVLPVREDRSDEWIPQGVIGLEVSLKYADRGSLILGGEYFYNGAGYKNGSLYPFLLFQDVADHRGCRGLECPAPAFQPLYLGQHYAGAYLVAPNPAGWTDTTIIASALANLSDGSILARLDYQATVLSFLAVSVFSQAHFGRVGEFRLGFTIPATPGVAGLEAGVTSPAPIIDFGVGISLTF